MSDESKRDWSGLFGYVWLGGVVMLGLTAVFLEVVLPHLYGATPSDILHQPLDRTPRALEHGLPAAKLIGKTSVMVRFRVGAARPYDRVEFSWEKANLDHPNAMRLLADAHENDESELTRSLTRRLHTFRDHDYHWGAVWFQATASQVSFKVERTVGANPNTMFDKQVEAARQVLLEAAFGIPVELSDRDITDRLGTGYPIHDVAKIDMTQPVATAATALLGAFPAMVTQGAGMFEIPVDHPLFTSVQLSWGEQAGDGLGSLQLTKSQAYAPSATLFETCLGGEGRIAQAQRSPTPDLHRWFHHGFGSIELHRCRQAVSANAHRRCVGRSVARSGRRLSRFGRGRREVSRRRDAEVGKIVATRRGVMPQRAGRGRAECGSVMANVVG
jgi:hypothetical protein